MTQTTFTDNVLIEGSQDIEQLRVQGHTTQDDPLQTWEDSDENVLAQITGDGRLQIGDDLGMATPDSLIEAHRDEASSSKPKRGIHSLGQISGTLDSLVQWLVAELELYGSSAIDAIHTALRVRASNLNTGTPTGNAELRGADIEVINDASASTDALPKATGLQVGVTNATGKTITEAVGLRVKMNNSGTITNPYAIYTEGAGPIHLEDYLEVKRPASVPGTPATDFMRLYPKSDGKLYAKNWSGTEYDLTASGGGGVSDHGALTGLSDDDHAQYLLASGLREWDEQASNPSTPATNKWKLFFKASGVHIIDDAGVVVGPLGVGGGAWTELVARSQLGSSAAEIDLTSIPSSYQHLVLLLELRSDDNSTIDEARIEFNNDGTAANYYSLAAEFRQNATLVTTENLGSVAALRMGTSSTSAANSPTGYFGAMAVHLFNYADSSRARQIFWQYMAQRNDSTPAVRIGQGGGTWKNASAAINQITIYPTNGSNWLAGSAYALYGIG